MKSSAVRELLNQSELTGPERVGVIDDAAALVTAGQLEPAIVLEQVEALVALNQIPITKSTLRIVSSLDRHLITDDVRPQYEAFIRATYGPLAEKMGFDAKEGETEEEALLRPRLLSIVGDVGRDPHIREEARRRRCRHCNTPLQDFLLPHTHTHSTT